MKSSVVFCELIDIEVEQTWFTWTIEFGLHCYFELFNDFHYIVFQLCMTSNISMRKICDTCMVVSYMAIRNMDVKLHGCKLHGCKQHGCKKHGYKIAWL